jgi:hypothetical protein
MKKKFRLAGITLLVMVFGLMFAACENPAGGGNDDGTGPADGTPWEFVNQSSYSITIAPSTGYTDQGWKSFTLSPNKSKTIRVARSYTSIYYSYNYAASIEPTRVDGENKIVFNNKTG